MRNIYLLVLLVCGFVTHLSAQEAVVKSDLIGLGMPSAQAEAIANIANGENLVVANADYYQAYDEAGNIHDILGVDSSGNTELTAPSSEIIELKIDGTNEITIYPTQTDIGGALSISGKLWTTAASVGVSVATGANTACSTTCASSGCFLGGDTATDFDPVECDDATADVCICMDGNGG